MLIRIKKYYLHLFYFILGHFFLTSRNDKVFHIKLPYSSFPINLFDMNIEYL